MKPYDETGRCIEHDRFICYECSAHTFTEEYFLNTQLEISSSIMKEDKEVLKKLGDNDE